MEPMVSRTEADPLEGTVTPKSGCGRFEARRRYDSNPINRAPIVTPVQITIEKSPATFGQ